MFKLEKKVRVEASNAELSMLRNSLLEWRNKLISVCNHTDPIDEILIKPMT